MMIADLVDQDDFYRLLQSVGIAVESHWTPGQCAQAALDWRCNYKESYEKSSNKSSDNNSANVDKANELDKIISELKQNEVLLLPEVKEALQMLL
ncbi:hypothetical protein [Neptunomonas antarctica]|uniref:Uncharacterized protein n=1 Tax=Neptunomonas antarctica TaxID=619304 RepID=A0A1N7K2W7_9GAMM|nr:hypothetical protein [Neptunomonas antarctica]SIS55911.1 hypothetical protein SAMN05421760_102161 [Neptunomonas antarctica]